MLRAWTGASDIYKYPAESCWACARKRHWIGCLFCLHCTWNIQFCCLFFFCLFWLKTIFATILNASAVYRIPCSGPCKAWLSVVKGSIFFFKALSPSPSSVSKPSPRLIHYVCFASRPNQSLLLFPHPCGKRVKQTGDSVLGCCRHTLVCLCVTIFLFLSILQPLMPFKGSLNERQKHFPTGSVNTPRRIVIKSQAADRADTCHRTNARIGLILNVHLCTHLSP